MRKPNKKEIFRIKIFHHKKRKREKRLANKNRSTTVRRRIVLAEIAAFQSVKIFRRQFLKQYYRSRKLSHQPFTQVSIRNRFGIELEEDIDAFLDTAEQIIDFRTKLLDLDLRNCSRVWPSGITCLCSLKQWVELTSRGRSRQDIRSNNSSFQDVNNYLEHSGFYEYVFRHSDIVDSINNYDNAEIVKIRREKSRTCIEEREKEIDLIVQKYARYDSEQMEYFGKITMEIFNNVTEHGISWQDEGWWVLAQFHKESQIISISIADNGIGIYNSLITGPQKEDLKTIFKRKGLDQGEVIKYAFETSISGSLGASVKTKRLIGSRYEQGSRRGNGLHRIRDDCKILKIKLSLLSDRGFVFFDNKGSLIRHGERQKRIFAGTLYHLVINTNLEGV